jgi:hypothetical protein
LIARWPRPVNTTRPATRVTVGARARVENAFLRYKTIIGPALRSRGARARKTEALIACNILNRMFEIARPRSVAIGT